MFDRQNTDDWRDKYRDVPVVVLGASGFIGRWVARFLTSAGADLYLPIRNCRLAKNIFDEFKIRGRCLKVDLHEASVLTSLIKEISPAIVFNLAGYGINRLEQEMESAYQINAHLPKVLCDALSESGREAWPGPRLVHVGSALEYGKVGGDLKCSSITRPSTLYGKSKLAGTQAVVDAGRSRSFPGLTARLFTVYGPGERSERLLPTLIAASSSTDPVLLTKGDQERDFTYVEDAAEALLRLGISNAQPGEVLNVATSYLTSVRSFIEVAAARLGIRSDRLSFGALETRAEEMDHSAVNIDRFLHLTGWKTQMSLDQGVRRTVEFLSEKASVPTSKYAVSMAGQSRDVCLE